MAPYPTGSTWAVSFTPSPRATPSNVVKRGAPFSLRARYKASRVPPASRATSLIPRARDHAPRLCDISRFAARQCIVEQFLLRLRSRQVTRWIKGLSLHHPRAVPAAKCPTGPADHPAVAAAGRRNIESDRARGHRAWSGLAHYVGAIDLPTQCQFALKKGNCPARQRHFRLHVVGIVGVAGTPMLPLLRAVRCPARCKSGAPDGAHRPEPVGPAAGLTPISPVLLVMMVMMVVVLLVPAAVVVLPVRVCVVRIAWRTVLVGRLIPV